MWTSVTIILLSLLSGKIINAEQLEIVNQWNLLNYEFPYDYDLNNYRPENIAFTGLEITQDRIFLAMPRLRTGVPATLATIPRNTRAGSSPDLRPYPDWSYHTLPNGGNVTAADDCNGIISVYRMRLDSCNRLWVLDAGVTTSIDDFRTLCSPKLMVFDTSTDQLVRKVIFPRQVLRPLSLLTNLVIDESLQGTCDSAFIYMTDTAAPGMVVYDALRDTAWRIVHPSMFPDPDLSTYTIAGESFTLMDGIVGLTHSPRLATVFFQPLATDRIFSIPTSFLTKGPPAEFEDVPVTLAGKKSSQGLGLALNTADDTLFFSPLEQTSVASWNPLTNQQRLLAYNPTSLQFSSELRWSEEHLWLLTTRFQKFFKRTVRPNEINLRIIRVRPSPPVLHGLSNNLYF